MENNNNNNNEEYLNSVAYAYIDGELLINYDVFETSNMNETETE